MKFPTLAEWTEITEKQKGLFTWWTGGSKEWQLVDEKYKRYAEARLTKGANGLDIISEFNELKEAYLAYQRKKEAHALAHKNSYFGGLWDSSHRNALGAMDALDNFVKGQPNTVLTEVEELAVIKYSFERALRLRTTLSGSRVTLQDSASWMAFKGTIKALTDFASITSREGLAGAQDQADKNFPQVRDWLYRRMEIGGLTAGRVDGTLSQNLRWAKQDSAGSRLDSLDSVAAGNSALESFRGEIASTVQQVQAAGLNSPVLNTIGNLSSAPSPTAQVTSVVAGLMPAAIDQIQNAVAQALNQSKDMVFSQMWRAATAALTQNVMSQAVSLVPVLNTAIGAHQVVVGIATAVKAYQDKNKCGYVIENIAAPGDPDAAFRALEQMLDEDFKNATVAAGQGAAAFAAGFDPTGTASVVTGAATAVYNLINDLVDFGLKYYQAVAANDILSKWKAIPFDGDESISYGLVIKQKSLLNDEIKALQAAGGKYTTDFTSAMKACPLLGCFFLTKVPAIDLVEMVASENALRHEYANVWFDCLRNLQVSKVEELISKATDVLANSKFQIISDSDAVHDLQVELTTANAARHKKFHEERQGTLDGLNRIHREKQQKRIEADRADRAAESALMALKKKEREFEDSLAKVVDDVLTPASAYTVAALEKGKNAVARATAQYKAETGGIHKLHTIRNDESNEARHKFKDLLAQSQHHPKLVAITELALYYMARSGAKPAGHGDLRPLRDASRLKKLLVQHWDAPD